MERYIYQHSDHMPPWCISYDTDDMRVATMFYISIYSEEIDNATNSLYYQAAGRTPFSVTTKLQKFLRDNGVTFTEEDFNQVEWTFANHF